MLDSINVFQYCFFFQCKSRNIPIDPFPSLIQHVAFDELESHAPFRSSFLSDQCHFEALLYYLCHELTIIDTIICKETNFKIYVIHNVVGIHEKQQRTQYNSPWYARQTRCSFKPCTTSSILLDHNSKSIQRRVLRLMPYPKSLHLGSSWGYVSNAVSKSNVNVSTCLPLSKI